MTWRQSLVAIVGLFLVVMFAATVQGTPEFTPRELPWFEANAPEPAQSTQPDPLLMTDPPQRADDLGIGWIVGVLVLLVAVSAAAALLYALVRLVRRLWHERARRRRAGASVGVEAHAQAVEEAARVTLVVQRGVAGALTNLAEHARPADAIIAAWVGLEESATDAGLSRARTETPAEFTLRLINTRAAIDADADRLLRLYERVRFGGHEATDEDRLQARRALEAIQEAWR